MADSQTFAQSWRRDILEHNYDLAITLGLVKGAEVREINGYNPDVAVIGVSETLWPEGGTYVYPNNAGEEMEIVSDNVADAQLYRLMLLDADFLEVEQFVTLNGTTPVVIPGGPYARVNGATNVDTTSHLGVVRVRRSGGAVVYSHATPDDQRSAQAVFTVPAGKRGVIRRVQYAFNSSGQPDSLVVVRFAAGLFDRATLRTTRVGLQKRGNSAFPVDIPTTESIPEKIDISVEAEGDSVNSDVTTLFTMLLFDTALLVP